MTSGDSLSLQSGFMLSGLSPSGKFLRYLVAQGVCAQWWCILMIHVSGEYADLQKVGMPDTSSPMVIAVGK